MNLPNTQTTGKNLVRQAVIFFSALWIFIALHCKLEVLKGDTAFTATNIFKRLGSSYTAYPMADLLFLVALFLILNYVVNLDLKSGKKIPDGLSSGIAALFSLSYLFATGYLKTNDTSFFNNDALQTIYALFCLVGYFLFFYFVMRLLLCSSEHLKKTLRNNGEQKERKVFVFIGKHFLLFSFIFIFLCYLPYILLNYPGSFCYDANYQLRQYFGDLSMNGHHPPLSSFILGTAMKWGKAISSANFGAFLYQLLQSVFGAFVFSFGMKKLYEHGLRMRYCLVGVVFFGMVPLWGCFCQWFEKDLLFTQMATLFVVFLLDVLAKEHCSIKNAVALIVTGVLAALLRNNGIYALLPALALLVFALKKSSKASRIRAVACFCTVLLIYGGVTQILYPQMGITNGSVREALSIPFQQTARYVKYYGDEVTEEEREAINSVLAYDKLAKVYNPVRSDEVKDTYKENGAKLPAYFKSWFIMFFKHPGVYFSAFFNASYGYMAPVKADIEASIRTNCENSYAYLKELGIRHDPEKQTPEILKTWRSFNMNYPLVRYLSMPGLYSWILILCAVLLLRKKKFAALLFLLPSAMNLLVCYASPLANAIRYALPTVAAAPLVIGWTVLVLAKDSEKRCEKESISENIQVQQ